MKGVIKVNEELKKRAQRLLNEKKILNDRQNEFYKGHQPLQQKYAEDLNLFLRDVLLEEERK